MLTVDVYEGKNGRVGRLYRDSDAVPVVIGKCT